ncbi:hypothetical protein [Dyella japonica]|uniref:Uncharacterized protein n=1 Tax=Dyella japonica A8 TaxID=1217721 RepID=A0A075JW22_9GAMM|nr:hypothetical protein [Dyella japonica]AIF46084.1 hypothetical protein HY57_01790 [Dyella japonica A8]
MSNMQSNENDRPVAPTGHAPVLKAWARAGGLLFALVTVFLMAYSAEWKFGMMLFDPLVWMVLLVALAAGLVCGYAVGVRVHERPTR